MYEERLARIKERLKKYAALRAKEGDRRSTFECPVIFNPVATYSQIEDFETYYDVVLPLDYKQFILQIADGYVGPGMGLSPLFAEPGERIPRSYLFEFPFRYDKNGWADKGKRLLKQTERYLD